MLGFKNLAEFAVEADENTWSQIGRCCHRNWKTWDTPNVRCTRREFPTAHNDDEVPGGIEPPYEVLQTSA